jgi:hypothetical protein
MNPRGDLNRLSGQYKGALGLFLFGLVVVPAVFKQGHDSLAQVTLEF